jgi:AraC family ethanolamine operon transcriptional activator
MCQRQHVTFHKFDPDRMLHAVRGGHTEHFLPRPRACSGELWSFTHADTRREVCVDSGRYAFEAVVRGTFRPGFVCLGFVEGGPAAGRDPRAPATEVNGVAIGQHQVQVYPENIEFFYHAPPGTRWTALQVRREDVQRTAVALLGRPLDLADRQIANLTIGPGARALLGAVVQATLREPPAGTDDQDALLAEAVLEMVCEVLDPAHRDGAFDEHQIRRHERLSLVRRAQDRLRRVLAQPYDSAGLCAALGVPERTLQLAFQRTLAMSPRRWLHTARLLEARRLLGEAHPAGETVAGIAARCGLTHAGRFSSDYRLLFGEAPSVTLRVGG